MVTKRIQEYEDGRKTYIFHKNFRGTIGNMAVTDINFNIIQLHHKHIPVKKDRIISIVQFDKHTGKNNICQIRMNIEDLKLLRDSLSEIIDDSVDEI